MMSGASETTLITEAQVANGELAYKLNASVSGGTNWYQNLDNGRRMQTLCRTVPMG